MDLAHPLRVAARKVIVDRYDVNAASRYRIEISGERRDERLALARAHLGDTSLMQRYTAHYLHLEVLHIEHALGGFAHHRERLRQKIVERLVILREPSFELRGHAAKLFVGHRREPVVEREHLLGARRKSFYVAAVIAARYE